MSVSVFIKRLFTFLFATSLALQGQATLAGGAKLANARLGGPFSRNGLIYVVFPPPTTNADYPLSRAAGSWWDSPLIDGVTVQLNMSTVAQINAGSVGGKQFYVPGTNPTGLGNCNGYALDGLNHDTDTCIMMTGLVLSNAVITFASPIFFPYDWTTAESTTSPGIGQWFQATPSGVRKTVNILDFSQVNGAVNAATPSYVTTSAYVNLFSPARQDVLNALTSLNTCPNQYGGNPGISAARSGTSIATVTKANHGLNTGDTIYVNATAGSGTFAQYSTGTGAAITVTGANTYTYDTGTVATDTATLTIVAASQSFLVPYELPYLVARQAFIKALFLHYNASYTNAQGGTAAQLGYWRGGQSAGGETVLFCSAQLKALAAPYTLAADTATTIGAGDNCFFSGACNTWGWGAYYTNDLLFQESRHPYLRTYNSINVGGTGGPSNMAYPKAEYPVANSHTNGAQLFDGVGEQGAALSDITAWANNPTQTFSATNPPNICGNFGCQMVQNSYALGMPIEVQQISISAYDDFDCNTAAHGAGNKCGVPSQANGGDSGDMRQWLAFYSGLPSTDGTNNLTFPAHASVLELYYKDAALALDPVFCTLSGTPATTCSSAYTDMGGTYNWYAYTTPTAYQFHAMQTVGLGARCGALFTTASLQATATGDCSYAAALSRFHGAH